ncbi:PI-PLC domain-containing protein [Sporosarcina gallistercoris]|uniref:Glycerophosphodiester phosphodiesterase n=1 Tax=Sporosarcina gallistercoris TaxID=2762245 RepID=A0ABR8PGE2_9BACL|nr:glycerophosphodiester phosphodiesterase [Sporosarcina gallistercoris]MBD7907236.1 glycerophosphodiester phosphodiesterase [Sporosarcina gallistercoris]
MGRKTKVALSFGAAGAAAWVASKAIIRPNARPGKKALHFEGPVVIQHLTDIPNSEQQADEAASLGVHGFAVDVKLTADEEIVIVSDEHAESSLCLLKDMLALYPHLLFIIRIADSPDTYEGSLMPSKLWKLLEECVAQQQVAVISQYDEQVDRFNLYTQHTAASGAGVTELKQAYAAFTSRFGHLYQPRSDLFVLGDKIGPFQPASEGFVQFLNKLNIRVYVENYETDDVIKLAQAGISGFITESPKSTMAQLDTLLEN